MNVREKRPELSDIQVLQREAECVKRKSALNCSDCLNCDLIMADERILTAYSNAIDALKINKAPTIDVAPIVPARWKYYKKQNIAVCTNCSFERNLDLNFGRAISCPNCGAKMDEVSE